MPYKNTNLFSVSDAVLSAAEAYGKSDGYSVEIAVPETLSLLNRNSNLTPEEAALKAVCQQAGGMQYTDIILVEE